VNLISLDGVSKALGGAPLFEYASLGIDSGERIGFVGRNGRGKSTFLRVLSGALEPDSGTIGRKRGLATSVLRQRPCFGPGETLGEFLYGGDSSLVRALAERRAAAEAEILERSYASLCTELGLTGMDRPMATLSGGMVKKAAIARALAPAPELLLLDEPTNHLDVDTIEWLERRLSQAPFAFVLVTHDRWFLDAVCDTMMDIERREIHKYPGGYSDYLERRIDREAALEKAESRRLTILKRELAWLGRGARARAGKSERRKGLIRDMQATGLEREAGMDGFSTLHRRLGKKILELEGVGKSYDGRVVLEPFSRSFKAGERVGIVGPNGSGKTTFLDIVSGRIAPDRGRVERGENTHFAYFDQTAASLDATQTVLGHVREKAERIRMSDGSVLSPEQFLERFLFPREMLELPLGRLSGGELRRLQLVRLLADSPNFLLLDEPTNDLDIDTIELLEDFVSEFSGCVVAVSHDRAFLDAIADSILVFDGSNGVREYVGRYADYRALAAPAPAASGEAATQTGSSARATLAADARSSSRPARRQRAGLSFAERRELDAVLDEISALEEEKDGLESLFVSSSPDPAELEAANRRYPVLSALIETKTARWEELASRDRSGE
jgi:ATP-binding cassette subfamily F protein uup